MDVILTHENADCDAIAALLAATKLYPSAVAVLPRRINRNAQDFLTLYGASLPFRHADDLPRQRIARVIVVDSQTAPSLNGMDEHTTLHFIDHHPLKRALPPRATSELREAGAATSLLVCKLKQTHQTISAIEATLMLLGIYEDTGALTYKGVRLADFQAATWLYEQGAQLNVAQDFLHHSLTPQQRQLYRVLLQSARSVEVAGYTVTVASAQSEEYVEEISTLAHYLRDVSNGDALCVLVQQDGHVQVVARSVTDAIDVSALAAALGGGGHARAAAALVREATLAEVEQRIRAWLQANIHPLVTAGDIMSRSVRTLMPAMTMGEAEQLVRRYGHEGFPVVNEQGELVGVLTRREIDRAMQHKLAQSPVSLYMHKGELAVAPDEAIERVRAIMIERGLGQVPVVSDRRLLGIITRTDLLKLWERGGKPAATTAAVDIVARLETMLPADLLRWIRAAGSVVLQKNFSLYAVGGFVRDLLLGQPNLDLDLVVEGDAIALAHELAARFGGHVHTHARFGTAKWILPEKVVTSQYSVARSQYSVASGQYSVASSQYPVNSEQLSTPHPTPHIQHPISNIQYSISNLQLPITSLDFISARREFYTHPTALPEVEHSSIQQDLYRRDFTINTLALCLDELRFGQLLDFFGGLNDLRAGVIRVLHNLSFVEDPTRILRAVRYEQRLGFTIETHTAELIADALELMPRVSGERVAHELLLIGAEREPEKALCRLHALGVLPAIHADLRCDEATITRCARLREIRSSDLSRRTTEIVATKPLAYLGALTCALPSESALSIARRLALSNMQLEFITQLNRLYHTQAALAADMLTPSQVARLLRPFNDDVIRVGIALIETPVAIERLRQYRSEWQYVKPLTDGNRLRAMGIPPAPIYREILEALRAARLDGRISTREEEEAMALAMANSE
jgi:tRNA nucleotidyltransferase (CCA-adding enzyme)